MSSDSKTVREVCAEIREYCDGRHQPYDTVMQTCANRIERIYECEIAAKDAEIERLKEERNHARLDAQRKFSERIALLERALKPVL